MKNAKGLYGDCKTEEERLLTFITDDLLPIRLRVFKSIATLCKNNLEVNKANFIYKEFIKAEENDENWRINKHVSSYIDKIIIQGREFNKSINSVLVVYLDSWNQNTKHLETYIDKILLKAIKDTINGETITADEILSNLTKLDEILKANENDMFSLTSKTKDKMKKLVDKFVLELLTNSYNSIQKQEKGIFKAKSDDESWWLNVEVSDPNGMLMDLNGNVTTKLKDKLKELELELNNQSSNQIPKNMHNKPAEIEIKTDKFIQDLRSSETDDIDTLINNMNMPKKIFKFMTSPIEFDLEDVKWDELSNKTIKYIVKRRYELVKAKYEEEEAKYKVLKAKHDEEKASYEEAKNNQGKEGGGLRYWSWKLAIDSKIAKHEEEEAKYKVVKAQYDEEKAQYDEGKGKYKAKNLQSRAEKIDEIKRISRKYVSERFYKDRPDLDALLKGYSKVHQEAIKKLIEEQDTTVFKSKARGYGILAGYHTFAVAACATSLAGPLSLPVMVMFASLYVQFIKYGQTKRTDGIRLSDDEKEKRIARSEYAKENRYILPQITKYTFLMTREGQGLIRLPVKGRFFKTYEYVTFANVLRDPKLQTMMEDAFQDSINKIT